MTRPAVVLLLLIAAAAPLPAQPADLARWERQAQRVTIIRDDWGIAHVYGRSDADAVFGMIYAQAEDDFNRIETNFLNALGRLAEAEGEAAIWTDLRQRLFIHPDSLRAQYRASPAWLRRLMDAWADGLNYFLHTHAAVRPRVLTRFEPWMALAFSEGSIGGDIESISPAGLRAFYDAGAPPPPEPEPAAPAEPGGSNGIALHPSRTANGRTLFLINPHTSFFFRSELQMVSEEGLNAYGAATWGQFFIYQGFNDRLGWMHTSSGVDNIDEYLETVTERQGRWTYRYGARDLPVAVTPVTIRYRTPAGMAERTFSTYRTRHGPVVRRDGARWVTVRLMEAPLRALTQSWSRTKARTFAEFRRTMDLHTNSSNNTIYADGDGTIAYFHANFVPRRDTAFDWSRPVDGSNPATDWGRPLTVEESPFLRNPSVGWLYNANDSPWWAAGADSPRRDVFPSYVDRAGWSARGRHAVRVLEPARGWTLDSLLAAAYDSYLPWFEGTIPALLRAVDALPAADTLRARLAEPAAVLRVWDLRWDTASVATALAVYWGTEMQRRAGAARRAVLEEWLTREAPADLLLAGFAAAVRRLDTDFGTWRTPWGAINRFQRLTGDIVHTFRDDGPSLPVGFTSAVWGSLASFGARPWPGTRRWYGTSGNSFVAVVEFGRDSVRARAITAGGESGDPRSPHFNDQAERYAAGNLRPVYFYREQLRGHTTREYRPGQ